MTEDMKLCQGTTEWFNMLGTLMSEAASRAGLSPQLTLSLVERYTDGVDLFEGLVQGIRFDITGGKSSFRIRILSNQSYPNALPVQAVIKRLADACE